MKALIMAGGKGTRLLEITKDLLPKPMVRINGIPLLEHAINNLKKYNIDEVYISVGYKYQIIQDYFKDGKAFGIKINYIIENEPLGSGGALYYLKDIVKEDFVVCMGDALFNINIDRMLQFHKDNNAIATLLTHPNSHPYDSDLIICDKNNRVTEINKKDSTRDFFYKNNVNAGFFIINPSALYYFDTLKKASMETDFIQTLINDNKKVFAYKSTEYIKDVGTPERFYTATEDLINNLPEAKNLKNKQKAIFLDRDGTLNVYKGFINDEKDLELVPNCAQAIKLINKSEYLAIIVSNQPVIARGECSFEKQDTIFNKLETLLGKEGAYVDGIYYCPHHPHKGYTGEIKELKIDCNCRKPKIGMIEKSANDFNLDLSKCYIIGDSNVDVQTGINAGIKTIRVPSDLKENIITDADYNAQNLVDAINIILNKEKGEKYERNN